jgi:hypothetical protein
MKTQEKPSFLAKLSNQFSNMKSLGAEGRARLGEIDQEVKKLGQERDEIQKLLAQLDQKVPEPKVDGRSRAARAAKSGSKVAKVNSKPAKVAKTGKIDGRTKEARAAKAKAAGKVSQPAKAATGKIDGRTKEGRAAKAAAAAGKKAAKKTGKKAAKKTGKKAAKKTANTSNAAEGRRAVARGDRPTMKEAIATVIGKATMGAAEVVEGLEKRDWVPNAAKIQQYVSFLLSNNKDVFERIGHGQYKVRDGATFTKSSKSKKSTPSTQTQTAASPTPKKKAKSDNNKSTDEELNDLGIPTGANVSSNPFEAS